MVEGLKDAAAAVSAQAAQAAGGATPGHRRRLSGSATSDSRAAAQEEAEAAWRSGGDGAKWLECLDDTDVAGKGCWHPRPSPLHRELWGDQLWTWSIRTIFDVGCKKLASRLIHAACSCAYFSHRSITCQRHAYPSFDPAVAERRLTDALHQLRRLDKLLARFVAAADRGDPGQQVGALPARALRATT